MSPSPDGAAVMLVSGGLDSLFMMGEALVAGGSIVPVHVLQDALWENSETEALQKILSALRVEHGVRVGELLQMRMQFPPDFAARWAVDPAARIPGADTPDEAVYLPGRNLALLLAGALVAQSRQISSVRLGVLDGNPFPDGTDEFLRGFMELFFTATGYPVKITKPLAGTKKGYLIRKWSALPFSLTVSCLRPQGLTHCGDCNKCAERRRTFASAGLPDPTNYLTKC